MEAARQTVSEDFSKIPDAAGVPYTYPGIGFTDLDTYRAAEKAGRLQDLTTTPRNSCPRSSSRCGPGPRPCSRPRWLGSQNDAERSWHQPICCCTPQPVTATKAVLAR